MIVGYCVVILNWNIVVGAANWHNAKCQMPNAKTTPRHPPPEAPTHYITFPYHTTNWRASYEIAG